MKKLPIKNEVELSKKTWLLSLDKAKGAEENAIETGRILKSIKERTKEHKPWSQFIEENYEGFFSLQHADRLIRIYENRHIIAITSNGDSLTIRGSIEAIKNATEEQKAEAERIRIEEQAEADRIAAKKAMEAIDKKNKAELEKKKKKEGWGKDEVIEGDFKEAKKEEPKKYEPVIEDEPKNKTVQDELEEMLDAQFLDNKYLTEENASLVKILESNDQVSLAVTEAQKLRDEIVLLK